MREKEYLRQRYAAILSSVGVILLLSGAVMLLPLIALMAYPQERTCVLGFALPASGLGILGAALRMGFRSSAGGTLSLQEGGVIVLLSWIVVILFSAWPFAAVLGLPFSRALFESVSGWTTTGLSIVDLTRAGPMILLWRSIIQLVGGAGLAIIMMSAIIGPTGVGIPSAEGRSAQLVPHVRQSARLVLAIYTAYALVGALAYRLAGMSAFDALNHAFAAVSTGGFSTRPESIGHWDSALVEAITLPLMLLGNLSFVTAWFLWRGEFRTVIRNAEVRFLLTILPLAVAALFLLTSRAIYPQLAKSVRVALFETVSALTTTGFSTVGYEGWNSFGVLLLITLMLIGGGTCSTAGGIKQFRIHLLGKLLAWDVKRALMPPNAVLERPVWEGERLVFVDEDRIRQVALFFFLYLAAYLAGVLVLCACGFSLSDSLFEFASAIGTVGLSVGVTSARMPDVALWAETLAMFLGRLEFTVVIVSLCKIGRDGALLTAWESKNKPF